VYLKISVNRLLSINENFFSYDSDDYHEVLFVYVCEAETEQQDMSFSQEDYVYMPITDLSNINLKPRFLLDELKKLPLAITHNVNKK